MLPLATTVLKRPKFRPLALAMVFGLAASIAAPSLASAGEKLETELLKKAPTIIRYLQEKSCKNVGVLKFRVKKGQEPASDNVGTFNTTIANRLQVALVLANDVNDAQKQIGIIDHASALAARIKGASHLTSDGLEKLFEQRYPLAWGNQQVSPDAFLTGYVKVSTDLRDANVSINLYRKGVDKGERVTQFTIATDPTTLFETGESFLLRGAFNNPPPTKEETTTEKVKPEPSYDVVVKEASKVKYHQEEYPLKQPAAPIVLEIFYDGKLIPIQFKDGRAFVQEPQQGQKVVFVLKRNDQTSNRYGIVLMVNGVNTLLKEQLPPVQCHKWILDPGDPPTSVRGFHVSKTKIETFKILSAEASRGNEVNYSADVGTISLAVFGEAKGKAPQAELPSDDVDDLRAITRGLMPESRPKNLAALKAQLWKESTRGLIAGGDQASGTTKSVSFTADQTPLMSVTITYFKP